MVLLDVDNVQIEHAADGVKTTLMRVLSYTVSSGETLAIVGESGSGKSVSSLSVMGLLAKDPNVVSERMIFDGTDLGTLSDEGMRRIRGADISMVFQEPMTSLNPVRNIGSQITESIEENLGLSRSQARTGAIELLREDSVADAERRLRQYPHHFSGGIRQRVMIAIALAASPKLIIADEPTTALDVSIQAQIINLLENLRVKLNLTYLFIGHDLPIVRHLCDRVAVMYLGRVMETATSEKLFRAPKPPIRRR